MKPLRWLLCGLTLVAIYRGSCMVGQWLFAELKELLGPQLWIANLCGAFGLAVFGGIAEWLYRQVDRVERWSDDWEWPRI